MQGQIVSLVVLALLVAACAPAAPPTPASAPPTLKPKPCDDGGSGDDAGVILHGVCL
jgi:hypothetical protein